MSSWSVTYVSLLINRNARAVSSEVLSRKRGVFFGFVLLLVTVEVAEAEAEAEASSRQLPQKLGHQSGRVLHYRSSVVPCHSACESPPPKSSLRPRDVLLSFFSLEPSLLSWREVLSLRPPRPTYPTTDFSLNTHVTRRVWYAESRFVLLPLSASGPAVSLADAHDRHRQTPSDTPPLVPRDRD